MRIHNLYTDAQGQSHFRDIEVEWTEEGPGGKLSKRLPATGIIFRQVQPDYDLDWHPAPRRQYIINLDAGVQITASDGEARVIGAGEIVLVEDTTGKGHLSDLDVAEMRFSAGVRVKIVDPHRVPPYSAALADNPSTKCGITSAAKRLRLARPLAPPPEPPPLIST